MGRSSNRKWLPALAIMALFGAACLNAAASPPPDKAEQQSQAPEADDSVEAPPSSVPEVKLIEPDWSNPNCEKPQDDKEADLCQQRRMADAAEETLIWNKVVAGTGIATAILLIYTIALTRRSVKTADQSVSIARDSAERQLRAYVSAKGITITAFAAGQPPAITLQIHNSGETPAIAVNARVAIRFSIPSNELLVQPIAKIDGPKSQGSLNKEGSFPMNYTGKRDITKIEMEMFKEGVIVLYIGADIEYLDVFGKMNFVSERHQFSQAGIGRGNVDRPEVCEAGNHHAYGISRAFVPRPWWQRLFPIMAPRRPDAPAA